jgi:thiol-disulfide isomerase/thioredoxin
MFKRKTKARKINSLDELQPMVASGRPVLINFFQVGCAPCQVMDGIVNELAREYGESAHIVKADIGRVSGAAETYKIRSTPTTVVIARPPRKTSKKARKKAQGTKKQQASRPTQRFRTSGLVKKDQLARVLESNGARQVDA